MRGSDILAPPAGRWILTVTAHDGWGGTGTTSAWLSVLPPPKSLTAVRAIELAAECRALAAAGDLARASQLVHAVATELSDHTIADADAVDAAAVVALDDRDLAASAH